MVVWLQFDDEREARLAMDGGRWQAVCQDLDNWLRQKIKHSDEMPDIDAVRGQLYELMGDAGLSLWD